MKKKVSALSRYLEIYEKNPHSKVFAPLSDAYRRLGMYQEALSVLRKGLAIHPDYLLGQVVLAHVYFDGGKDQQVVKVLEPLVLKNLDHHLLQKLYAKSNLNLGRKEEALEVLKNLYFLNPKDREVVDLMGNIEGVESGQGEGCRQARGRGYGAVEEWVQVDFGTRRDRNEIIGVECGEDEVPLVTHTLVDLYRNQGVTHKAIQVLEKMVELNPKDSLSRMKLESMKQGNFSRESEEGELLELWDEKFSHGDHVERVLLDFLHAIKLKQDEKSSYY